MLLNYKKIIVKSFVCNEPFCIFVKTIYMRELTRELIYDCAPDAYDVIGVSTGPGQTNEMIRFNISHYESADFFDDSVILDLEIKIADNNIDTFCWLISLCNECYLYCKSEGIDLTKSCFESYIMQSMRDTKLNQIL